MKQELKEKLTIIVGLVDKNMADPDIDIEYCIPGVETTSKECDVSGDPFISVKYAEDKYIDRKVYLTPKHLQNSSEEIANRVTFTIEQFKSEVDALKMGE